MHCWNEKGRTVFVSIGLYCGFKIDVRTSLEGQIRGDSPGLTYRGCRLFGKLLCRLRSAFGVAIFVVVLDADLLVIRSRRGGRT